MFPKRYTFPIILTVILVVSMGTYLYMQKTQSDMQKAASVSDFNIIFKYGVGAKNELNTYNGTYTKDKVSNPPITTDLALTVEEKWHILQKIDEMDFFIFPNNFPVNPSFGTDPQVDYYIRVQNGSQLNEVSWSSNSLIEGNIQSDLKEMVDYLQLVIEQKAEYKALPTPIGGYY